MLAQSRDCLEEEFSRPVESIMRCEDFKSNFARRLSNRYISRSPVSGPRQDSMLKLRLPDNREAPSNAPERIEPCPQLSKCCNMEQNGEASKPPDKSATKTSDIQRTEVNALNMEVETLRWQLAQTEANRQMHIALLKQIVTFLNRVKEHIECQKNDTKKDVPPARALPKSFNLADLPRSRSVLHVNKNIEYSISTTKKISTRKISKSISNVNGYKDCSAVWNQSKMSLVPENETGQKISEEMSRLITLANTVLSTKLPDLACACTENVDITAIKLDEDFVKGSDLHNLSSSTLNLIREDSSDGINVNCNSVIFNAPVNKLENELDRNLDDFTQSLPPIICDVEHTIKLFDKEHNRRCDIESPNGMPQNTVVKRNDYNAVSNFIEDESGFSSMSSFQEIGIPIISIIPPSPCKEVGYLEEIPDIIEENEKWKTNTLELDKQNVKVFWV
ncbi:uncharacterized protein [Epargyreus clarus]|uniref:uncharacterized protein n=1 Tax=Epargyreus clarus TaxID=520877 RepID=UPI003C2E83A2